MTIIEGVTPKQATDILVEIIYRAVEEEDLEIQQLEEQKRQRIEKTRTTIATLIRHAWPYIKDDPEMPRWVVAFLYWNIPKMTVSSINSLFNIDNAMSIAKDIQIHGYLCHQCGKPIHFTSRTSINPKDTECHVCREARYSQSQEEYRRQHEAYQQHLNNLKTMSYAEYLQTEEWKSMRLRMMKRSNFRCQLCNGGGRLNVHHRTYERRGNEDYKDLIVLCEQCHAKFHDKIPQSE